MGRVLPFISVSLAMVAVAVFQAQSKDRSDIARPLSSAHTVTVETLDQTTP